MQSAYSVAYMMPKRRVNFVGTAPSERPLFHPTLNHAPYPRRLRLPRRSARCQGRTTSTGSSARQGEPRSQLTDLQHVRSTRHDADVRRHDCFHKICILEPGVHERHHGENEARQRQRPSQRASLRATSPTQSTIMKLCVSCALLFDDKDDWSVVMRVYLAEDGSGAAGVALGQLCGR